MRLKGVVYLCLIMAMCIATETLANPAGYVVETQIDRPGEDYKAFDIASHGECQAACTGDPHCTAYTYVRPGIQGPQARCWLKASVPAPPDPVVNPCCDSGGKAPPGAILVDNRIDRPGEDYKTFDTNHEGECLVACGVDPHCAVYTYVRPGIQGPQARCWLKASVPDPVANSCCNSGVKASPVCPTGRFNFYTDNDPSRDSLELVIVTDKNGNCSGAIKWHITGTTATWTELKLDAFSYEGGAWYDAWNTRTPGDRYTIYDHKNGEIEVFWGIKFSGHARKR